MSTGENQAPLGPTPTAHSSMVTWCLLHLSSAGRFGQQAISKCSNRAKLTVMNASDT